MLWIRSWTCCILVHDEIGLFISWAVNHTFASVNSKKGDKGRVIEYDKGLHWKQFITLGLFKTITTVCPRNVVEFDSMKLAVRRSYRVRMVPYPTGNYTWPNIPLAVNFILFSHFPGHFDNVFCGWFSVLLLLSAWICNQKMRVICYCDKSTELRKMHT